ncbi:hypothetical protein ACFE33_10120 [Falsihalocynthiibacter sp. SS001]|uniref:hypothetical protein n=1 Tax=Falsihalocynthiibacter sp. SS001 TaxID=3349698 RepID=UPI0036D3214A
MSDTDSFIDEVNEEVRQDRLFGYLRKYGWIGGLLVVALVGGTAVVETQRASKIAAAEDFGDQIITALMNDATADRVSALSEIEAPSQQSDVVLSFLRSGELVEEGDTAAQAVAELEAIEQNPEAAQIYKELAAFKAALLLPQSTDASERKAAFEALIVAGGTFRLLAEEQVALIEAEMGDTDAAIARLNAISQDAELTVSLRQRVNQWKLALGAETEAS